VAFISYTHLSRVAKKKTNFLITILYKLTVNFTLWKLILRIWWFNSGVHVLIFDRTQYLAFKQIMGKVNAKY